MFFSKTSGALYSISEILSVLLLIRTIYSRPVVAVKAFVLGSSNLAGVRHHYTEGRAGVRAGGRGL